MTQKEPVLFSWSGGKDSAMALHELQQDDRFEVVALLTTVAEQYRRVSHHGVREELLEMQAESIGVPLDKLYLPVNASHPCTNAEYEELMGTKLKKYRDAGVRWVAHGDIFLEDLRAYRERNLARIGMEPIFPIWKRDTTELVKFFIAAGFEAFLSCVDGKKLDRSFAGRSLDESLIRDLPSGVDPCGEYGEYHSFVYKGPIFRWPLQVAVGEIVERDTRFYADLLPEADRAERQVSPEPLTIPPV